MPNSTVRNGAKQHCHRAGLTLLEATAAVAVFGVLAVIVAQCIALSLRERARTESQQAALELADNVLESARAQPWDKLDQAWADAQSIPSGMQVLLPDGAIRVKVEAKEANLRRVAVEVTWQFEANLPPQSVQLVTLLAAREAKKTEAQP